MTMAITTPFGRGRFSAAQFQSQIAARAALRHDDAGARGAAGQGAAPATGAAHKWRLLRSLSEARGHFGLSDRALGVLDALLSFHPETALTPGGGLVVHPSNRELALRARGVAVATLQRALGQLVEAGLVIRRDSPNGKRYVRRGAGGEVAAVYGFDLAPLVARAGEIEAAAEAVRAHGRRVALLRERITLHRRDIGKIIAAACEDGAPGDWDALARRHAGLSGRLRRQESLETLEPLAQALDALHLETAKLLESFIVTQNLRSSDSQDEADNQNSKTETTDIEPGCRGSRGQAAPRFVGVTADARSAEPAPRSPAGDVAGRREPSLPLGLVLKACPDIAPWARGGVDSWRTLQDAAALVRPALGISPDAWQAAREALGDLEASITLAAILQKGPEIRSPGGYLRSLTEKAASGQFSLGPVIMALVAAQGRRVAERDKPAR